MILSNESPFDPDESPIAKSYYKVLQYAEMKIDKSLQSSRIQSVEVQKLQKRPKSSHFQCPINFVSFE